MIELELNPELSAIDWERISELFQLVNWGYRSPEDIQKAFQQSSITCFAKEGAVIVGFGRTVDDGKYYALLVDVVIHPNYQAKGLGTKVVGALRSSLNGYEFITLSAAPNKHGFYHKLGWKKQKSAFIYPKDQKQIDEHCA